MVVAVKQVELRQVRIRTRFPFRYGITTLTEVPYLIVRIEAEIDGQCSCGYAADVLPPKWFTKVANESFAEELGAMLLVIRRAAALAVEIGTQTSIYNWWRELLTQQLSDAAIESLAPLLKAFGVSLLERAVIDASCHRYETTFHSALHANLFEIRLSEFHPELGKSSPSDLLESAPISRVSVRHTVGLGDPLTSADIAEEDRAKDDLPHALDDCIRRYGLRYFKIKLPSDLSVARERLIKVSQILEKLSPGAQFTLDGNEFFKLPEDFLEYWSELHTNSLIRRFLERGLLLVEQPIHRETALSEHVGHHFACWPERPPIIIDESDAEIGSFALALQVGYDGTSHKNCKGVFKGIANACLVRWRNYKRPSRQLLMTGEDLMNIGPIALMQDLAVGASLGFTHMERNGHHYVAGLDPFPISVREQAGQVHGDLFANANSDSEGCWPRVAIKNGEICIDSVNRAPFGTSIPIIPQDFELISSN